MSKLKAVKPCETKQGKAKICIFGKSGLGKTWLALDFPSVYYIDTEGGADLKHYQEKLKKSGGVYFGIEQGSTDFKTVIEEIKTLATEKHEFKTVAIGSITKLWQIAIANEQENLGENDVFGASKKPAIQYMRRLLNWVHRLDMNVIFESHEVSEWGKVGKKREEIGQSPDVWEKLIYELDLTLRIVKAPSRICQIKKSRLLGFPESETFDCNYEEFAKRFGKDFIDAPVVTIELCNHEQISEIERLLSIIKIDQKEIEKVLSKANAENWTELNTQQADATIKWLKGKIQ